MTDHSIRFLVHDAADRRIGEGLLARTLPHGAAGDGVAYQGTHHRHGRLDANPNRWSAHLFLHWVERDGRYRDQAFDRPALERHGSPR